LSFHDRLADDVKRIFLGSKTIEEDLVFVDYSGKEITVTGSVEIDSFNTSANLEADFSTGISSQANFYVSSIWFGSNPKMYEQLRQSDGTTWNIKQMKREHGMWTFGCTAREKYRRNRIQ